MCKVRPLFKFIIIISLFFTHNSYSGSLDLPKKTVQFLDRDGLPLDTIEVTRVASILKREYIGVIPFGSNGIPFPRFRKKYDEKTLEFTAYRSNRVGEIEFKAIKISEKKPDTYRAPVRLEYYIGSTNHCERLADRLEIEFKTVVEGAELSCNDALDGSRRDFGIEQVNHYYQDQLSKKIICRSDKTRDEIFQIQYDYLLKVQAQKRNIGILRAKYISCLDGEQIDLLNRLKRRLNR
jgi:hypothetical protein